MPLYALALWISHSFFPGPERNFADENCIDKRYYRPINEW
jgi:hypothetical protein